MSVMTESDEGAQFSMQGDYVHREVNLVIDRGDSFPARYTFSSDAAYELADAIRAEADKASR